MKKTQHAAARLTRAALFERVIQRVIELLERDTSAKVTWDDRISDPDTPKRKRQVDITVRKDGLLTLIECRLHRQPQDVSWIEELIGRRASMGADAVVGVSSSGFTRTARNKAKRFGIHLRDVADLSDAEVREWGRSMRLEIGYHQFQDVEVALAVADPDPKGQFDAEAASKGLWPLTQTLFNSAAEKMHDLLIPENRRRVATFEIKIRPHDCMLHGRRVVAAVMRGRGRLEIRELSCVVVKRYDDPLEKTNRQARLQSFALGETSATYDGDVVSVAVDVTNLGLPALAQLRYVIAANQELMTMESFELIGSPAALYATPGPVKYRFLRAPPQAIEQLVPRL